VVPTTTTVPVPVAFTDAVKQWKEGSNAAAVGQGIFWTRAVADLQGAIAADPAGTAGYANAVAELQQLVSLPLTGDTSEQQMEGTTDVSALDAFFGANGFYGISAPSTTLQSFVATLQQEVRSGAIPGVAATPDATVTCAVLSSLAVGSGFGCSVSSPTAGSSTIIGEIEGAQATSFTAAQGPPFTCNEFDNETSVLNQLGQTCS
jgi:hypothetical protein